MAEQASSRQKLNTSLIVGLIIIVLAGGAYLLFSPSSPLRPQASEINVDNAASEVAQEETFRSGTVNKVSGNEVTIDEPNSGSFTFVLGDIAVVRSLNDESKFEIVDRGQLNAGDVVSVFYQNSDVLRVDIIKAQ